jgi:asparagine synthase (glutamine-hydrolysing)
MCGIAGLVTRDANGAARLARMTAALAHRGPDDFGSVSDGDGVHLGHRRLSIIDLSANGHQPMSNEDGTVWLTYNGEVYDTPPLAEWLASRGHRFVSRTDSETLVHLYEEEGTRLLNRINGMFAFAIHDRKRGRLLLARDHVGVKPLFYAWIGKELLFASEIKAILAALPGVPSLRADVLGQYLLQGYASGPATVYEGIHSLLPGHFLDVDVAHLHAENLPQPVEYWDPPFVGDDPRPEKEITRELTPLLEDAVRICMMADVPLGAFLSGGLDSSTVVALMAKASPEAVRTFTMDVPGLARGEHERARAVADLYHTRHTELVTEPANVADYWRLTEHFDAPFNCPSLLNAWLVSRAARRHVTVALSGDGGDELFGGYGRYLVPRKPARPWARRLASAIPSDLRGQARLAALGKDDFSAAFTARHPMTVAEAERMTGSCLRPWVDRMRGVYERHGGDSLTKAMYLDFKTYLPDHVLAKVDSASMSVSLEVRVPLLDRRVVAAAGRIPSSLKVRDGISKWLFRRMVSPWLPDGLANQGKVGFDPPLASWIFDNEREACLDQLARPHTRVRGLLDGRMLDQWIARVRRPSGLTVPRRAGLWAVYQLDRWLAGLHPSQP